MLQKHISFTFDVLATQLFFVFISDIGCRYRICVVQSNYSGDRISPLYTCPVVRLYVRNSKLCPFQVAQFAIHCWDTSGVYLNGAKQAAEASIDEIRLMMTLKP